MSEQITPPLAEEDKYVSDVFDEAGFPLPDPTAEQQVRGMYRLGFTIEHAARTLKSWMGVT